MEYTTPSGTYIRYEKIIPTTPSSKKTPIIILHGRGGSSKSWLQIGEMLADTEHTVYIPDIPGFGRSPIHHSYTVDTYRDTIYTWIQTLGLSSYILIGHSNGGRISISLASHYPQHIAQLILINTAGIPAHRTAKHSIAKLIAKCGKPLLHIPGVKHIRTIFYRVIGGHDYIHAQDPFLRETFLNMIQSDLREQMKKIQTPTTLIRGSKDSYTPLRDGKTIHSLIPQSKLTILQGEKHGIHLQNPQVLYSTLSECLV